MIVELDSLWFDDGFSSVSYFDSELDYLNWFDRSSSSLSTGSNIRAFCIFIG